MAHAGQATVVLHPTRPITSILSSDTRLAFRLASHLVPSDVGRLKEGSTQREGERWQFKFESERDLQTVMHALRPFLPPSPSIPLSSPLSTPLSTQPPPHHHHHYPNPPTHHHPPPCHSTHPLTPSFPTSTSSTTTSAPTATPDPRQSQIEYPAQEQTQYPQPERRQCLPASAWDPPLSSGYPSQVGRLVQQGHGHVERQSVVGQRGRSPCAVDEFFSVGSNGLSHTQRYEPQEQVQGMQGGWVGPCAHPSGPDQQLTQSNSKIQPFQPAPYQPLPVQPSARVETGHGGARAHPGLPQASSQLSHPWTPSKPSVAIVPFVHIGSLITCTCSDVGPARSESEVSQSVPLGIQERVSEGVAHRQDEGPTMAASHQSPQRHSTAALKRDVLDMLREYDHDVRLRSRLQSILQAIEAQPVQKVPPGAGPDLGLASAPSAGASAGCSQMHQSAPPVVAKSGKAVRRPIRTAKKLSCRLRNLIRLTSPIKQRIAQTERKLLTRLSVLEKEIQKIDQTILSISSQDNLANAIAGALKVIFKPGSEVQICQRKSFPSTERTAPIHPQISVCAYDDVDALAESTRRASLSSPPGPTAVIPSGPELRRDQTRNDSGPVVNVLADLSRLPTSIHPSISKSKSFVQAQSHQQHAKGLSIPKVKLRRIKLVQSHKYTDPQLQSNGKILVANSSFFDRNSTAAKASSPTRKRRCLITEDDMGMASEPDGG